jgi:hypothetical protein
VGFTASAEVEAGVAARQAPMGAAEVPANLLTPSEDAPLVDADVGARVLAE